MAKFGGIGFDGEFRRRPQVSLRGSSAAGATRNRSAVLEKAQEERLEREKTRREIRSAVCIQKWVRSYMARKACREAWRKEIDQAIMSWPADKRGDVGSISELVKRTVVAFESGVDCQRLLSVVHICNCNVQLLDASVTAEADKAVWRFRISRLVRACIALFSVARKSENINSALRFMEIFSKTSELDYPSLVRAGYYRSLRRLCDDRLQAQLDSETATYPHPLGALLMDLALEPLLHCNKYPVLAAFTEEFLAQPLTAAFQYYLVPAFRDCSRFPVHDWVSALAKRVDEIGDALAPGLEHHLLAILFKISLFKLGELKSGFEVEFLRALHRLLSVAVQRKADATMAVDADSDDEDAVEPAFGTEIMQFLNQQEFVKYVRDSEAQYSPQVCRIAHDLLVSSGNPRDAVHTFALLRGFALRSQFLRGLWNAITAGNASSATLSLPIALIRAISNKDENEDLVTGFAVFVSLFSYNLLTVHDMEFYEDKMENNPMPFSLGELVPMAAALRDTVLALVEGAFPTNAKTTTKKSEQQQAGKRSVSSRCMSLCLSAMTLLNQLHSRDARRKYCPNGFWNAELAHGDVSMLTRLPLAEEGLAPSTTGLETARQMRWRTILKHTPFVIPFHHRVQIFRTYLRHTKERHQGDFLQDQHIDIKIRRKFLYEDAFEKLSYDNEPSLLPKLRVQLVNVAGMDEAGIDGGGLLREFLTELAKTSFDPNRGFFKLTRDNLVYPNPNVALIEDRFQRHYFFIGRILGKCLLEGHLIDIPMAGFFIEKMLGSRSMSLDINHMSSLDPELHRNLLYLKTYDGDVSDLNLDFTLVTEEFGQSSIHELKPGGSQIGVDNKNKLEYIQLVSDFKLNKQIGPQCSAFREGLKDVIDLNWLGLFSCREFQILLSGSESDIDVADLRQHTKYGQGFHDEHDTIRHFWEVVSEMSERQRKCLLKFVTSCSRPPLSGFKELQPPFCIQNAGPEESRLPTASTCLNLLKLPDIPTKEALRAKLLYAIESEAGFELS